METLHKTWFVDIDGTIFYHQCNDTIDDLIEKYGESSHLHEKPIKNAIDFFKSRPKKDRIIITTAREGKHKEHTLRALNHYNMRYDQCLFDLAAGPRVVVNDIKPPGVAGNTESITTAYAVNLSRDKGINSDTQMIAGYHKNINE